MWQAKYILFRMNPIEETRQILMCTEKFVRQIPEMSNWLPRISEMEARLSRPCVLAVAGRVKAGKSSFLNALLGVNLAKVGELETTATINRFCYGEPSDPSRPVMVVWENGMTSYETLQFMDSLQGHDEESLRKAEGISYLEFRLKHELLKEVTLVDTPGTDAVVGEDGSAHQKVVEKYFNLRNKHNQQTLALTSKADAVIYLVGAVATGSNKSFLDDFRHSTSGSSALNAIGVLSKVDVDETLLANRHKQAKYVAESLRDQLNSVVPVSAGICLVVNENKSQLPEWQKKLKSIPLKAFEYFMRKQSIFLTDRPEIIDALYKGSNVIPLSVDERKNMLKTMEWSLFRAIAHVLYNTSDISEALRQLDDISNMESVRHIIDEQFFNRSKTIRCIQVLNELQEFLAELRYRVFPSLHVQSRHVTTWTRYVRKTDRVGEEETKASLLEYLQKQALSESELQRLEEELMTNLILPLERLKLEINSYDTDYAILRQLEATRHKWPEEDYEELCNLFGLYGSRRIRKGIAVWERQSYWMRKSQLFADSSMRHIAEHAVSVYGECNTKHNNSNNSK